MSARKRSGKRISSVAVGAAKELVCCADLLDRGCHAFRAVSPDAPFDVVGLVDERLVKIQVTAGSWRPNGKLAYDKHEARGRKHDVIGVVVVNNQVHYVPELFGKNPRPPAAVRKRRALDAEVKAVFERSSNPFEIAYQRGWSLWLVRANVDAETLRSYHHYRNERRSAERDQEQGTLQ
jgi:hypothetical protein